MSETQLHNQPDEAMVDLLVKQVTEGLSPAEQRALDAMDGAVATVYLRDFERAAAAVTLAAGAGAAPMPASMRERLTKQAEAHFAAAAPARVADLGAAREAGRSKPNRGGYGWLAAAACLVLAVFGWIRQPTASNPPLAAITPPVVVTKIEKPPAPPKPPTPAEARATMLANSESLKVTLAPTKDSAAAGVTADVVWDPSTQTGFMHLVGLAVNDPAVRQYQMWIFDGGRDKRYPVDGGVFDVPADTGEVVIPIRATLPVLKLAAFAVTVEKPGGAVVSGREHVVALGAAG